MQTHLPTLLLREWMQHKRGWLIAALAPPLLFLAMLPIGSVQGLPDKHRELVALIIVMISTVAIYGICLLVALFQLRADCGLRRGGLPLAEGELEAAATAVESLRARAESAAAAGRAAQTALVNAAKGDDVVGIGMRLSHARKLASAYARTEPYTNLAGNDFVATLDWILHEDALTTRGVAPIPDLEAVRAAHFALPSESFPSDHVCLVADLEWSTAS